MSSGIADEIVCGNRAAISQKRGVSHLTWDFQGFCGLYRAMALLPTDTTHET